MDASENFEHLFWKAIESRVSAITQELQRDSRLSGRPIDQRAIQAKIERLRGELLDSHSSPESREILEVVADEVAKRLRIKLP